MDTINQGILLKKGAEASLYLIEWYGRKAIVKVREPKRYRPEALDNRIRSYRTIHEPQLIHEAKCAGVSTPLIYMVNVEEASIVMEYIEGPQIKKLLNTTNREKREILCNEIGKSVARLHNYGLIHGDLTTSNMIKSFQDKIVFVDFGLGEKNGELEAKGVDLHLLKRSMQSTHYRFWEQCFQNILKGYTSVLGVKISEKVYEKIKEIEKRGRYVEERRQ
ncbi:MAG: Kae1-associated kinase Bud32 [Candidatus Bathyarchaeota archaeon]|nr:Kae1-associated kinase Bud32 [Candidatus Bathyarchaeota archaeon]MDD4324830.1 Kae1-associated kinase Bud32 [Candidatus Bathyarchaeota archaeon]MDI9576570.1 Kae1-associated kinase Bud32 [Thermoproteota archaeon]